MSQIDIMDKKSFGIKLPVGEFVWNSPNLSTVGVVLDKKIGTIKVVHLSGACPPVIPLFCALLADEDVREMIRQYQENGNQRVFRIYENTGSSGSRNIFICEGSKLVDGFLINRRKRHLLHISSIGKLNSGFGDEENGIMEIGDFVEVAVYLGITKNMEKDFLIEESGAKYFDVPPEEYMIGPSHIL